MLSQPQTRPTPRVPRPAEPGSLALPAYLICTSVMMWLELNYGALM